MSESSAADRPHTLYRFYDSAERLLYVGTTVNLPVRIQQHQAGKSWWAEVATTRTEHYSDQRSARSAEQAVIESERPRYNLFRAEGKTPIKCFRLPEELRRAAQAKADRRGESVTDVVRAALEQYVSED